MFNPYQYYNPQAMPQDFRYTQFANQQMPIRQGLQGKIVDSIDVVKATDVPLDGSISVFPLADSTAIATKQLQQDGTTKIVIYKPIDQKEEAKTMPRYVTESDMNKAINELQYKIDDLDLNDMKDDMKLFKKQIKELNDYIKDLKRKEG